MADRNYKMNVTLTDGTVIDAGTILVPESGESGTGITSIDVDYSVSTSSKTPGDSWTTDIPTVDPGQYLWTRVVCNLSDETSTTSYMVSYFGVNGADGDKGDDGVGVSNVTLTEV